MLTLSFDKNSYKQVFTTSIQLLYNRIMRISAKIDQIMKEKGLTDADIANETGLPRMTVGNARRGKNITLVNAQKIAKALKESVEKIWPYTEEKEAA